MSIANRSLCGGERRCKMICDIPDAVYHGRHHQGHKRCIIERRRLEAKVRSATKMATPKTVRSGQGVAAPHPPGRRSRSVVS
jgi:hypothetical protein